MSLTCREKCNVGLTKPVVFALPVTKARPVGYSGCRHWRCSVCCIHRVLRCIDLITVRFRPVSGFTSADKAELEYVISMPSGHGFVTRYERKFGVSLFD